MPTTTNFGWTTPADTDLVKDGALAIRTLGNGIDTSFIDLKGGTTGQVLSKATNTDLDFTWIAAPSGAANWTAVNSGGTALSGSSTVTITGVTDCDKVLVLVVGASFGSGSTGYNLQINSSNTGYTFVNSVQTWGDSYSKNDYTSGNGVNTSAPLFGYMGSAAASEINSYTIINGCNTAGAKVFFGDWASTPSTLSGHQHRNLGGYWSNSATVSTISLVSTGGNFDAGTVYVFKSA